LKKGFLYHVVLRVSYLDEIITVPNRVEIGSTCVVPKLKDLCLDKRREDRDS